MSDPFLGEIKLVSWNLAPRGWAFCNGQILAISQNTALYSLIGTMYGGDGVTTFALPDLRGMTPVHMGPASRSRSGEASKPTP
jgi:microcystin-dependent protein